MKKFEFDEKTHKYLINEKPATGVTTILGVIAKPALISWSARMASDYVLNNLKDLNDLERVCEEAKNAHRKTKEEAGQKGTDVHAEIEEIIKWAIKNNKGVITGINPESKQVENFIAWSIKNKVKFLDSEKKMYSEKFWFAGTCDFTCEIDGKKYVGDIKTSSGIYDRTPFFQVAGYRMMLEEMGEKDFEGSIVINIKKNGIFNEDNDVYCSLEYKDELDGFLACLTLYRKLQAFGFGKVADNKKSITI